MVKLFGIYNKKGKTADLRKQIHEMHKAIGIGSLDYASKKLYAIGHEHISVKNEKGTVENDDIIVCLSGRIYDYENELNTLEKKGHVFTKYSAEEFILNSYIEYGLDFIIGLNGKFVISIYDNRTKSVYIINDRFGMKPLYYYADDNLLVFGSEIKAILTEKKVIREIDWSFWKDIFSYRCPLGIKTPYIRIKSLPNATILKYNNGTYTLQKYWDYDSIKINYKRNKEETITQGVQILKKIFIRQTNNLKECTVLLSGGYDSRCIISSIKKFTPVDIQVYSIAKSYYVPQTNEGDLDTKYSQQVCNKLNVKYTIVGNHPNIYKNYFVKHLLLLDGITSESLWIMPILDEIDTNRVNFDGLMGDILLRDGWLSIPEIAQPKRPLKQYAKNLHNQMIRESEIDPEAISEFFDEDIKQQILPDSKEVEIELSTIPEIPYRIKIFHLKNISRNMHALISNDVISRKTDTIFPFCDNEFAEFAFSIPPKMKVNKNIYLEILRRAFPDVMKVPTTNDPKNVKEKLKKSARNIGLMPIINTVKTLKKSAYKIIRADHKFEINRSLSKSPRDVKYLIKLAKITDMPRYINKKLLLKRIDEHIKVDRDPSYFLEPIMHFCMWHEKIYAPK
jgi:asparagine synthase (glutamine-hydrolysing)